jgi:hypothetical protein
MKKETIVHGVQRNLKHKSLAVWISASGEHMTLFLVSFQATNAVETRLKQAGFKMGVAWILEKPSKSHMSAELLDKNLSTVFLPYIEELRSSEEFAGRQADLLMDNCLVCSRPDSFQKLTHHRVKVITFLTHIMYLFQSLDLSFYGTFKKRTSYQLPFDDDETTAAFVKSIFHRAKQTLVEDIVQSAFVKLGPSRDIGTSPCLPLFDGNVRS